MRILERPNVNKINAIISGASGVGKTTLATALFSTPELRSVFGEKGIYVAWDKGSDAMQSVSRAALPHLIPVVAEPKKLPTGTLVFDPYDEATAIARADWSKLAPEAKTLIWDGWTGTWEQVLQSFANAGHFSEKNVSVGSKGEKGYISQPQMGDYGIAQNSMMQTLGFLLQQPLNIILVCVEDWYKPEGGSYDTTIGGPATVGGKSISKLAKEFDNLFRVAQETKQVGKPGGAIVTETKRLVYTERRGIWMAKVRKPPEKPNTIAEFTLSNEPHKFWEEFLKLTAV